MYTVTLGEVLPVIGSFGNHLDYTVRLKLRLRDKIDDHFLKEAVEKTRRRYPYLCVRMKKDNENYFYEENLAPIAVLHTDSSIRLNAEELGMSYRRSACMDHPEWTVLRVYLKLTQGDSEEIRAVMDDLNQRRRDKQPLTLPSAGSFFKRPQGDYAARLIEAAGLKGFQVGGAGVSGKHAGFVVNLGDATARDVLSLMEQVRERVEKMSGIRLEPEVRIVGVDG